MNACNSVVFKLLVNRTMPAGSHVPFSVIRISLCRLKAPELAGNQSFFALASKTLIRLRGCASRSGSSLTIHMILVCLSSIGSLSKHADFYASLFDRGTPDSCALEKMRLTYQKRIVIYSLILISECSKIR